MRIRSMILPVCLLASAIGAAADSVATADLESWLHALEDAHDMRLEPCGGGPSGLQLCGTARRDREAVAETVRRSFGDRVDAAAWEGEKKTRRLRSRLWGRDVRLELNVRKGRLVLGLEPALPDCGDDPRLARLVENDDNPDFVAPVRDAATVRHPVFPERARVERVEGRVEGLATLDVDGRLADLCLIDVESPGYGFEAAFYDAVRRWRYRPATLRGETITVPLRFWSSFDLP